MLHCTLRIEENSDGAVILVRCPDGKVRCRRQIQCYRLWSGTVDSCANAGRVDRHRTVKVSLSWKLSQKILGLDL